MVEQRVKRASFTKIISIKPKATKMGFSALYTNTQT
jgi:hypothetical protein